VGVVMLLDRNLRDRYCPLAEQRQQRIPSLTFPQILPLRQCPSVFDVRMDMRASELSPGWDNPCCC
jgi:hypothetical protein